MRKLYEIFKRQLYEEIRYLISPLFCEKGGTLYKEGHYLRKYGISSSSLQRKTTVIGNHQEVLRQLSSNGQAFIMQ